MISKVTEIRSMIESMKTSSAAYYSGAEKIWALLSPLEQDQLNTIIHSRFPVYKNEFDKLTCALNLISYGVVTWSTHLDNEGYVRGTAIGLAALKSANLPNPNVTLPGESKRS